MIKQRIYSKFIKLLLMGGMLMLGLSGCGKTKTAVVNIRDAYTQTQLEISSGETVKEILDEAEIALNEQDRISPSLDTRIENDTEITILRYAEVQVRADEQIVPVSMTGKKVKDALKDAGVTVDKNDYINHDQNAYLTDGMSISVIRRVNVSVTIAGLTEEYLTEAGTVNEFLLSKGIRVGKKDRITPKSTAKLKEGTEIVIKKTDTKDIVENEVIKYDTKIEYSDSMDSGTSKVTTSGRNGEKKVTYRVTYVDGKEESRKVIKEEIIKKPVTQVIVKGTKKTGKEIVSKEKVYDCDGSGHGYYIITYADGSVEYEDF